MIAGTSTMFFAMKYAIGLYMLLYCSRRKTSLSNWKVIIEPKSQGIRVPTMRKKFIPATFCIFLVIVYRSAGLF